MLKIDSKDPLLLGNNAKEAFRNMILQQLRKDKAPSRGSQGDEQTQVITQSKSNSELQGYGQTNNV